MATVIAQPRTGSLHLPAVLHNSKPLTRVLNHFESSLVRLFEAALPGVQPLRVIAGIDPYLAQALAPEAALQQDEASFRSYCMENMPWRTQQRSKGFRPGPPGRYMGVGSRSAA